MNGEAAQVAVLVPRDLANERFKKSFASQMWSGIGIAVILHFAIFAFSPRFTVDGFADDTVLIGDPVPPLDPVPDIPPPPKRLDEPRPPVPPDPSRIPEPVPDPQPDPNQDPPPPNPEPPPPDSSGRGFVGPVEVDPILVDEREAQRIVERLYPRILRDAGIGGHVLVEARVTTEGTVDKVKILESSGFELLDRAALRAVLQFRFFPAMSRDTPVSVPAVTVPVTFSVR